MKKIVGTIAAIALAASSAFAGVGLGSWGRAIWEPVKGDKDDVKTWEGVSWGGNKSRVGVSIFGASENVGFNLDINGDGGVGLGDLAQFWAKPFSWLEVKIGQTQDDTGRGCGSYGIFNWHRMGAGNTGDDLTFTRFGNGAGGQATGAIVKLTPVEGLWIIAALNVQDDKKAEETYAFNAQYGIGYTINNIGLIRAQYIGGPNAYNKDGDPYTTSKINVAFDLTAVENVFITAGAYIPLGSTVTITEDKGTAELDPSETTGIKLTPADPTKNKYEVSEVVVAAYANIKLDPVALHIYTKLGFGNDDFSGAEKKFHGEAGLGADFDMGNGIGLNADARLSFDTKENASQEVVFLAGLTKSLTNGMIGLGFQGDIAGIGNSTTFAWSVPVVISASF